MLDFSENLGLLEGFLLVFDFDMLDVDFFHDIFPAVDQRQHPVHNAIRAPA
jgi:hypothetical protein